MFIFDFEKNNKKQVFVVSVFVWFGFFCVVFFVVVFLEE